MMVQLLLQMQREQAEEILALKDVTGASDEAAIKRLVGQLRVRPAIDGAAASAADLLMAGFDPSKEPYLRLKVADMVKHSLEELAW